MNREEQLATALADATPLELAEEYKARCFGRQRSADLEAVPISRLEREIQARWADVKQHLGAA